MAFFVRSSPSQSINASPFIQGLLDDPDRETALQTLGLDSAVGYDIVLLAGQSNMVGWTGSGLNPALDTTDPRIRCWPGSGPNQGQIILASDPLPHREQRGSTEIGLGMTFAREYVRTIPCNRSMLLVCAALGGTG
ncbi:MAG: sialate O-acetylesterase, partial [Microcoleus sp.]